MFWKKLYFRCWSKFWICLCIQIWAILDSSNGLITWEIVVSYLESTLPFMLLPMAFPRKFCKKWVIKVDTSTWYIFQNVTREREASKTVILITQHPSSIRFYRSLGRKCLIERFSYYAIPISWIKLRHVQIQFLENFKILRSLETHGNQSTGLLHTSIYWFPFTGIYLYWERNTQQKNRILFESQQSDHYNWLSTCCN